MTLEPVGPSRLEYGFERKEKESSFEKAIFSPRFGMETLSRRATIDKRSSIDDRMSKLFSGAAFTKDRGSSPSASGGVSGTISWGGAEGTKAEVRAFGGVEDRNGNYAKAEVSTNTRGESSATISAGNDKESSTSKK
jgi:hypothetical protein